MKRRRLFSLPLAVTIALLLTFSACNLVNTYTVTFNSNGGGDIESVTIDEGGAISNPGNPAKDGFTFDGWYDNPALEGDAVVFPYTPAASITLYAKWKENPPITVKYTVSFNSNGGGDIESITVDEGDAVSNPGDPEKGGFTFDGWYDNAALEGDAVVFPYTPAASITLYAKWKEQYTVSFNSNGGGDVDSVTVDEGDAVSQPDDPEKGGFTFDGWYDNAALEGGAVVFPYTSAASITLYAKWTENLYEPHIEQPATITIKTNSGNDITGDRLNQEYVGCTVSVDSGDEYALTNVQAEVKVRGNYTANYEKKPYRIKFSSKQAMLGLNGGNKYKNWVLLAEYKDSSMTRNSTAFYLGKNILSPDGYYSADYRYVEVYVNSTYKGLYVLTEQQQVGAGRVDINEAASGYTGTDIGYFYEFDGYYTEEPVTDTFTMDYDGVRLTRYNGSTSNSLPGGYTIKNDMYSTAQRDFIADYTRKVFRIAYQAAYQNKYYKFDDNYNLVLAPNYSSAQETIESVIDVRSLVDVYIINEICNDMDISWSSFSMSADMSQSGNKKLTFQAPWDFDSSLGLAQQNNAHLNEVIYAANSDNPWLILLVKQSWYWETVKARWQELSGKGVFQNAVDYVTVYSGFYESYYAKNFEKWPNSMGVKHEGQMVDKVKEFKKQSDAAAYLHDWLQTRINYLESVLGKKA